MRENIHQIIRVDDMQNLGNKVTIDIYIDKTNARFCVVCDKHVNPITLFEIIKANRAIRKLELSQPSPRRIYAINDYDSEDYYIQETIRTERQYLTKLSYEEQGRIKEINWITPDEFDKLLRHIMWDKYMYDPGENQHYKQYRNYLTKHAYFLYCHERKI